MLVDEDTVLHDPMRMMLPAFVSLQIAPEYPETIYWVPREHSVHITLPAQGSVYLGESPDSCHLFRVLPPNT